MRIHHESTLESLQNAMTNLTIFFRKVYKTHFLSHNKYQQQKFPEFHFKFSNLRNSFVFWNNI